MPVASVPLIVALPVRRRSPAMPPLGRGIALGNNGVAPRASENRGVVTGNCHGLQRADLRYRPTPLPAWSPTPAATVASVGKTSNPRATQLQCGEHTGQWLCKVGHRVANNLTIEQLSITCRIVLTTDYQAIDLRAKSRGGVPDERLPTPRDQPFITTIRAWPTAITQNPSTQQHGVN